jgi:hypothetical protein
VTGRHTSTVPPYTSPGTTDQENPDE